MRIFLSHKMSGLSENQVKRIRNNAIITLRTKYDNFNVIDNYHHENVPEGAGRLWHLGTSIRQLDEADAVYFCKGWYKAKGCIIEYIICKLYKKRILK